MLSNRNVVMLNDYIKENNVMALNTVFQKRSGQKWTHRHPNGSKSQLDYVIINQKWKNSARNCRAFNSFTNVGSDHRIVSATITLSLRANRRRSSKIPQYDWSVLKTNELIKPNFVIELKNRFSVLQETAETQTTANSIFKNFEDACKETAEKNIPLKPKVKKRNPWETPEICMIRDDLQKAIQKKDSQPTPTNNLHFKLLRDKLKDAYESEQSTYLQNKIDIIKTSQASQKSAIAWKTINEIAGRKSCNKSKLKASNQDERVTLWKKHKFLTP